MDKYDFDKKIVKLEETISKLGCIREDMSFLSFIKFLRSRLDDAICDLEDIRSDLEAFGDEINEENKDEHKR